jgi:hypothetical protein
MLVFSRVEKLQPARLDRFASVPGAVVPIIHNLLDGGEERERPSMTMTFRQ